MGAADGGRRLCVLRCVVEYMKYNRAVAVVAWCCCSVLVACAVGAVVRNRRSKGSRGRIIASML